MGFIEWAIKKQLGFEQKEALQNQTWEMFEKEAAGKKVFLFGTGAGLEYFFRNCCEHMEVAGVIDNGKERQGEALGWYSAEVWRTEYENIPISDPAVLRQYREREVVVLITSVSYYREILDQLKQMGVAACFVMLAMEANRREQGGEWVEEDFEGYKDEFLHWCCGQDMAPNKIVMQIGEYGGHARQITKQLLRITRNLDIVWIVTTLKADAPEGVRLIYEKNWKSYLFEMETARMWLFDISVPDHIIKRENQIYIQTKHWSSITLKKFYLDDKSTCLSAEVKRRMKNDGKRMDYLLTGSELDEISCGSGFAFEGKFIRIGSARSDVLFDPIAKEKVFAKFQLNRDVHIVLYAPTFRKKEIVGEQRVSVSLDTDALLQALSDKMGGEWVLFLRLHPHLAAADGVLQDDKAVIHVADYPDSEELVAACDVMVTDYSSIMFEGAFVKKPVLLYAPDWQEYIGEEREFLLDYHTLPFPLAKTNEELKWCVLHFDEKKFEKAVMDFLAYYGVYEDGHAGERAAAFILSLLQEK